MAVIGTQQEDPNNPTGGGGSSAFAGGGTGQGATTSVASPAPTSSGSFTNLSSYLNANQGAGATMGNAVGTMINNAGNAAQTAGTQAVNDARTTGVNSGAFQKDDNTAQKSYGTLTGYLNNAAGGMAGTGTLIKDVYNQPGYSSGENALDAALVNGQPGGQQAVQGAANQWGNFSYSTPTAPKPAAPTSPTQTKVSKPANPFSSGISVPGHGAFQPGAPFDPSKVNTTTAAALAPEAPGSGNVAPSGKSPFQGVVSALQPIAAGNLAVSTNNPTMNAAGVPDPNAKLPDGLTPAILSDPSVVSQMTTMDPKLHAILTNGAKNSANANNTSSASGVPQGLIPFLMNSF